MAARCAMHCNKEALVGRVNTLEPTPQIIQIAEAPIIG